MFDGKNGMRKRVPVPFSLAVGAHGQRNLFMATPWPISASAQSRYEPGHFAVWAVDWKTAHRFACEQVTFVLFRMLCPLFTR